MVDSHPMLPLHFLIRRFHRTLRCRHLIRLSRLTFALLDCFPSFRFGRCYRFRLNLHFPRRLVPHCHLTRTGCCHVPAV